MMGWLKCRFGRHDWAAELRAPGTKEYIRRCARCREPYRVGGFIVKWHVPQPPRKARRQAERDDRKADAMLSRADRDLADLERFFNA